MTFWETVQCGEYIMIALAVIVIVICCIWISKSLKFERERKSYSSMMQRLRDYVMEGDIENARNLCQAGTTAGSRVVGAGINNIGDSMHNLKLAMHDAIEEETEGFYSGMSWIKSLSVISPLLGLGGTLIGITDRLRDIGERGGVTDLSVLSGAISPTIVTTVAGLGVGIFAIVAYTCLDKIMETGVKRLKGLAYDLTELLNEPSKGF